MSHEYVFVFSGTKDEFLKKLGFSRFDEDGHKYILDDYIVEKVEEEVRFGIERTGHSGGQWFIPTITECDGKILLRGTIQYIGPKNAQVSDVDKESRFKKYIKRIGEILLHIIVLPIVLLVYIAVKLSDIFKWLVRKIKREPMVKIRTTEDRLLFLMENRLGCVRVQSV